MNANPGVPENDPETVTDRAPWLVVVDMQHAFQDPRSVWACEGYAEIEPAIAAAGQRFAGRTVYTRFVPDPEEPGQWRRYYDRWPSMRQPASSPLWELTRPPAPEVPVISRPTFSKWGAELASVTGAGAPLVLAGVATECCVLATALGAADAGREVTVLADLCRGASRTDHEQALSVLHQMAPLVNVARSTDPPSR